MLTRLGRRALLTLSLIAACAAASAPLAAADSALDRRALRASIAGLPDPQVTSGQVRIAGSTGHWSARSGVATVSPDRPVPACGEFRIGSVTKMFTAAVVLQLVGERRVDLDETVQHYLPGVLPSAYPAISVRQVLTHTSGLPMSREDAGADDPAWSVRHRFDRFTPRQIVASAAAQPMTFAPGHAQQYNGVNYILVVERVTGRPFARELRDRITRPLHLAHTYLPGLDDVTMHGPHAHGYVRVGARLVDVSERRPSDWTEGGMVSTTADLTRFLRALFAGRVVPRSELRAMLTVPDLPYAGDNSGCAQGPDAGRACFSAGLQRTALPGGPTVWGKSGGEPGYSTLVVGTRDGRRVLGVSLTPTGNRDGTENAYLLRIAAAAYGIAAPT